MGSGWRFSKVISAATRTIKHVSFLFMCVGFAMLSLSVSSARTCFAMQQLFTSLSLIFEPPTPHNIAQRSKTQKKHAKKSTQPPDYTTDAPITQNVCCTAPLAVTNLIYLPSLSVRLHLLSSHHTMPCICRAHCKMPQTFYVHQPNPEVSPSRNHDLGSDHLSKR